LGGEAAGGRGSAKAGVRRTSTPLLGGTPVNTRTMTMLLADMLALTEDLQTTTISPSQEGLAALLDQAALSLRRVECARRSRMLANTRPDHEVNR
jgi:hypothetical protein